MLLVEVYVNFYIVMCIHNYEPAIDGFKLRDV